MESSSYYTETHNMIRWKSGRRIDPRLLALLESFEEIYTDRHELFKKIFHGGTEEVYEKIGAAKKMERKMKKVRSMSRSMSMRAIGTRGIDDEIDGLRLDRFKVRTPVVIVAEPDDGQGKITQGSSDS